MKIEKTKIRAYAKRIREDLRDLEAALKADDADEALAQALDAMGATAEITSLIEYAQGAAPWGYRADGTPRPPQ
jgi:hypothetical protein